MIGNSRRFHRVALGVAALAALVPFVAACSSSSPSNSGAADAAAAGSPKDGGNLTFLIQEFPTGWVSSESNISSYEGNLWGEITDKLVYVSNTGAVSPWIATSWQTEDNATKYILHLKSGVTFSDGEPLNAAAVVDNITLWAKGDPSRGIAKVGLFPALYFEQAKAVNTDTVEVDFSKPTLGFIPTLGYHGSILLAPKTLALSVNKQANLLDEIGSGPFVVKSYQTGVSYTLVKRADYDWGPPALGHTGPAYLDSLTYKVVADESTREQAVVAGDAQVDFNVTPSDIPSLESQGFTVATPRYLGFVDGFEVDASIAPTNSLDVRQALQHAINRTQILNTVYPKGWELAQSFIQSNVPEAQNDSALFSYDPTLSAKLLTEAGWVLGANGYRTKGGQTLSLTLIPNPYVPSTEQEDELIAQQLAKVGIKAALKIIPLSDYASVETRPYPPLLSVSRSFIDFSTVGGVLTSLNNGENWFSVGTSDKTLDTLSQEIESASSTTQRDTYADQVQQYVLTEGYFIPVVQQVQRIYLIAPNVHGVAYNGVAYANFYTAWLS
ncbi:MAG: ABC transporter substrate-binding protein [Trebonia sp.]|jgi:peptide/nickel transport system substrate-binding protein